MHHTLVRRAYHLGSPAGRLVGPALPAARAAAKEALECRRRVRILVVTNHRGIVGGVELYLRSLLPALEAKGHELVLAYEYPSGADRPTVDDRLSVPHPTVRLDSASISTQLRELRALRPDVLFVHACDDPRLEETLIDAQLAPAVAFVHAYQGLCISGTKRFSRPVERPCERAFGPACLALYLPRGCGGSSPVTMTRLYREQRSRLAHLKRYSRLAVASGHMRTVLALNGVQPDRVDVAPLFPANVRRPERWAERKPQSGRVLAAGRFGEVKGFHQLISAVGLANRLLSKPVHLMLAGDGPERESLSAQAKREGVTLELPGWLSGEALEAALDAAELFAFPSTWPEPFGLAGLEAAARGVPTLAFDVGGVREWLVPGATGEVAALGSGDPAEALAEKMVALLSNPTKLAESGRRAWEHAASFTLERHVEAIARVLHDAVSRAGRVSSR